MPSRGKALGNRCSTMTKTRFITLIPIGLLIVATIAISFVQPSALDVARSYCSEKGIPADDLGLLGYQESSSLLSKQHTVTFQMKGSKPAKRFVVELQKPVYFLPWHVADFQENTAE